MAATGFTPISLYYSATASAVPLAANLTAGELALNTADGKLYYKNSSNVVTQIAGPGAAGTFTNLSYTGTLTGGTGVVNLGSGQFYKDASGNVGIGTAAPVGKVDVFASSGGGAGTVVPVSITVGDTSAGNAWPGDGTLSTVFNYYSGDGTNTGVRWRHGVGETIASGQYSAWKLQYRSAGGAINDYTGFSDAISVDFNGNTTLGAATTNTVTVNGYMGVGGAPYSGIAVYARNTALLQTSQVGFQSSITGSSAGTNSLYGLLVANSTEATAYTVTNAYGARVNNVSLGAGSAITSQHGFYIADLTSGTNNYGITSAVSSGTNKWNIYASGTALNYFAAGVGMGTSAPLTSLHVNANNAAGLGASLLLSNTNSSGATGNSVNIGMSAYTSTVATTNPIYRGAVIAAETTVVGNGHDLIFSTNTTSAAPTEKMRITYAGNVLIGTTTAASTQGATVQAIGAMATRRNIASAGGPAFRMEKSRATTDGTYTIVASGDTLGEYQFYGADGVQYIIGASVKAVVDATPGVNDMPTALTFNTTADGAAAVTERMRIDSSGNLLLGTTTSPAGSKELVLGGDYIEGVVAIGSSGTAKTIALTNGTVQTVTLTGNCTFTMPTAVAGKSFTVILSTGAGSFTATFTSVKWPANTAPTITTTASRWDILSFISDGTNWYGNFAQAYQ